MINSPGRTLRRQRILQRASSTWPWVSHERSAWLRCPVDICGWVRLHLNKRASICCTCLCPHPLCLAQTFQRRWSTWNPPPKYLLSWLRISQSSSQQWFYDGWRSRSSPLRTSVSSTHPHSPQQSAPDPHCPLYPCPS